MTGAIALPGTVLLEKTGSVKEKERKSGAKIGAGEGKLLFLAIFLLSLVLHLWMLQNRIEISHRIEVSQVTPSVTKIRLKEVRLPKVSPTPVPQPAQKPAPKVPKRVEKQKPVKQKAPIRRKKPVPVKKSTPPKTVSKPVQTPVKKAVSAPATKKTPAKSAKPRPAAPSPQAPRKLKNAYLAELLQAIESRKFYPKIAKRRGMEGVVKVRFVLQKDGRIEKIAVAEGSGYGVLDRAALKTVASIGAFKPIPEALKKERWEIVVPIRYQIETR